LLRQKPPSGRPVQSGRAQVEKGAKADGQRIGPLGFGVRPSSAAGERIVVVKAVAGHRTPGRWRVVPATPVFLTALRLGTAEVFIF